MNNSQFQTVIVGASIAGCSTALRLADKGVNVAIIEKQATPDYYKKMCSHIIHPSGLNALVKLGLWDELKAQGAQKTYMDVDSQGDRLFYPFGQKADAANIERRYLDPAIRALASKHPKITIYYGYRVKTLLRDKRRVVGLTAENKSEETLMFRCPLVIAADGRVSRVAKLDGCQNRIVENHRVALFSYFRTSAEMVPSKIWVLDKGDSYIACFPNTNKVLLSCYIPASKFKEISDTQAFYNAYVKRFIESQGIQLGDQADDLFIAKDTSTLYRSPNSKGLVFVGDAFLSADPLTGIGCSWAMSSAALLSRCIGSCLLNDKGAKEETGIRWQQFKLNCAVTLYSAIHRIKYLLPAYLMAWLSLKGKFVFNKRLFGVTASVLGKKAPLHCSSSRD